MASKLITRGSSWVETSFTSKGFLCVVLALQMGYRCGYMAVPKGHPWHGKGYDEIEPWPEVHGGLTFASAGSDVPSWQGVVVRDNKDSWWLGFDCAHLGDARDFTIMDDIHKRIFKDTNAILGSDRAETIKTRKYVKDELRSLARQAKEASRGK